MKEGRLSAGVTTREQARTPVRESEASNRKRVNAEHEAVLLSVFPQGCAQRILLGA
jgi:hypothetical protein